jgi:putative ABC transport system substrate-binding protein
MRALLMASCAALASLAGVTGAQSAPPRVVWVSPAPADEGQLFFEELRRGLRDIGQAEGRSLRLEAAWGDGTPQRAAKLMAEVVASAPAIIVTQGSMGPVASKATTSIPAVFGYSGDPIEAGMVDSLPRPGRNMTGISYMTLDLVGKRMELLKEVLPTAKRIAVVASPDHPGDSAERRVSQAAAARLGIELNYFELGRGRTVADVLAGIETARSDAVMFFPTQTVIWGRRVIAEWSLKRKVPTISGWAPFADGGNLLSYGPSLAEASRRLAFYVDRILKGAKPGDLPVELPTRVELIINQKTARALGVTVPPSVLLRADRVIE